MRNKLLLAACASFVVSGCTQVDTGFGETTRWNMAQQVINPDPVHEGEPMEGGSGVRAAGAVDRYNKGTVKEPATIATTATSGAGGSNSGLGTGPR